jgi:hypothetical protein
VGSAAELALGIAAVVVGGAALWWAVAASYLAFGAFVVAALRHGTMIGSCGCFGREETPPHWSHVALDAGLAGVAVLTAQRSPGSPLDALADDPAVGVAVTPCPQWPCSCSTPPSSSCRAPRRRSTADRTSSLTRQLLD